MQWVGNARGDQRVRFAWKEKVGGFDTRGAGIGSTIAGVYPLPPTVAPYGGRTRYQKADIVTRRTCAIDGLSRQFGGRRGETVTYSESSLTMSATLLISPFSSFTSVCRETIE